MSVTKDNINSNAINQDMERQQYEILYKEMDVPLIDMRKKYLAKFFILSIILLVLTVLFASFVKIPNYLQVPITLENTIQDHMVLFNHQVRVEKHYVTIGERVKKGQAVCKISSPEIQNLISKIKLAENNINALKNYDSKNIDLQIKNIDSKIELKNKKLKAIEEEKMAVISLFNSKKRMLESKTEYARVMKEKNAALYKEGLISQFEYLEFEKKHTDKLNDLSVLHKTHSQLLQQFEIKSQTVNEGVITNSIKQIELASQYDIDERKLTDEIELARQNLSLFYGRYELEEDGLILIAPVEGKITYYHPNYQLLKAGEMLYRLELNQGHFECKGHLFASDIGYVKSEMKAIVMLETFPHYEWGSLSGEVMELSISPSIEGKYSLTINIVGENPKVSPLLQNGQTGIASMIIEERSLFSYLFRDLKRTASEMIY